MYRALYRTYRPETFREILGQEHIVKILQNQINTGTVGHAYLFCGTRGTGKTTMARLLAKGVNCLSQEEKPCGICANCIAIKEGIFIDVIEIDAASHNGVDNIRELRESVKYSPAVGSKKVYIIDEVHMLSTGAFNALLKTLEEPPEHVMFILATTEPQKLPATILSRCMRLDFKRVPEKILCNGMAGICDDMRVEIDKSALRLIAINSDGSVRDALSILDQCISIGKLITRDDVLEFLGTAGQDKFIEMTGFVTARDVEGAFLLLDKILADGKDARQFTKDWLAHYRNLMITKFVKDSADLLNISSENCAKLAEQSSSIALDEINQSIIILAEASSMARLSTQPRILLELAIVKMAQKITFDYREAGKKEEQKIPKRRPPNTEIPVKHVKIPAVSAAPTVDAAGSVEERPQETPSGISGDKATTQTEKSTQNLEAVWNKVFEAGETTKSSFNIIRTGTALVLMNEQEFHVSANNSLKLRYLEENRKTLENLIQRITGKMLKMVAFEESLKEEQHKENLDELKARVESALGISVTIE